MFSVQSAAELSFTSEWQQGRRVAAGRRESGGDTNGRLISQTYNWIYESVIRENQLFIRSVEFICLSLISRFWSLQLELLQNKQQTQEVRVKQGALWREAPPLCRLPALPVLHTCPSSSSSSQCPPSCTLSPHQTDSQHVGQQKQLDDQFKLFVWCRWYLKSLVTTWRIISDVCRPDQGVVETGGGSESAAALFPSVFPPQSSPQTKVLSQCNCRHAHWHNLIINKPAEVKMYLSQLAWQALTSSRVNYENHRWMKYEHQSLSARVCWINYF